MTDYLSGERIQGSSTSIVVGDATVWDSSTGIENVTISNSNLTATSDSGSNAWDNYQAQSTVTWNPANLASGEEFQVTFKVTNDTKIGGLAFEKSPSTNIGNFGNVDFGMYMVGNGGSPNYINCMESGSSKAALGDGTGSDAYDVLDSFKMTMDSAGAVKYFRQAGSSGSFVEITGGSRDTASGDYYLYHYSYDGSYGTVITSASPTQIKQDDKSTITDVPVGTRYEETDTRKIFRRSASVDSDSTNTGTTDAFGLGGGGGVNTRVGFVVNSGYELIDKTVGTVSFWLYKADDGGYPSGNVYAKVYNSSNTLLYTSSNYVDAATLPTTAPTDANAVFSFVGVSGLVAISQGDYVVIEGGTHNATSGNGEVNMKTSGNNNAIYPNANCAAYNTSGNWITNYNTRDVWVEVNVPADWVERGTA